MTSFAPSGVITLTTDFGLRDPFVGVMKGRIFGRFPQAHVVDLTHGILPHWPAEAGFWLLRSFRYFPAGTVHIAVVDPGVGTSRDILVVEADGHVFIAPDNGLLAPIAAHVPGAVVYQLDSGKIASRGIARPSATFHGRDIFAPLAADLAAGRCRAAELGTAIAAESIVPSWVDDPAVDATSASGVVITIDHFGNLVTNIDAETVRRFRGPLVHAGHHVLDVRRTYGDVRPGELLALINSFEVLEIACAEGSAEAALGLSRGAPVVVRERIHAG